MKTVVLATSFAAVGALLAGGVVWAQTPPQINACVERTTGYFKLGSGCGQNLAWNVQGPQGPAGPAGPVGPQGPPGQTGQAPVQKQIVVTKNSAFTNGSAHTALARCPAGGTVLYGGAGLIVTGKPDNERLRITYSRPSAAQGGVPYGWSAGAMRVQPDRLLALTLWHLARAERHSLALGAYQHSAGSTPSLQQDYFQAYSAAKGMFEQAVAQGFDAAVATPPASPWGVQAWVVCGM